MTLEEPSVSAASGRPEQTPATEADCTSHFVTCADREIHVTLWGEHHRPTIVMWHGLARTGRDFDTIAARLARRYRVICPDTLGRGLSQWANDPKVEYSLDFYAQIALELLDVFEVRRMRWVGTSMGGALGIRLAADALTERITHLVINDIGPELAPSAVDRILNYAGSPPDFASVGEFEEYLRTVYVPFGYLTDAEWQRMAETSFRRRDNGRITVHYDPRMVEQFTHHPEDYDQWDSYDRIVAKTMVLRGSESDLLLPHWAEEMTRRGPKCRLEVVERCGHAPPLNNDAQIGLIEEFFES